MAATKTEKPAAKMVPVFIERASGEDPFVWVGVNGKSWSIPRGKTVEVPEHVAKVLEQQKKFKEYAYQCAEAEKQKAYSVQGK